MSLSGTFATCKIADGLPLSVEERSWTGHHCSHSNRGEADRLTAGAHPRGRNDGSRRRRRPGRAKSRGRLLSAGDVEELILKFSQSDFELEARNALHRDLNVAIYQYNF